MKLHFFKPYSIVFYINLGLNPQVFSEVFKGKAEGDGSVCNYRVHEFVFIRRFWGPDQFSLLFFKFGFDLLIKKIENSGFITVSAFFIYYSV
jgi:hypothetical protein